MPVTTDDRVLIRQLQGIAVLLSCLPAQGKARELFTLALASPYHVWQDKVQASDDADSDAGMKTWLEGVWAREDLSGDARKLVDWQADSDNMTAALAELRDVASTLAAV
jgi:hypothetical protein